MVEIHQQLEVLRRIWPSLEDDYQLHQSSILHVLQGKAQAAASLIDSVIGKSYEKSPVWNIMSKRGETKRLKYAVWAKQSLDSVSKDLKEWSELFDVSWYLIIRMSSSTLHQLLATNGGEPVSALKDFREAINSTLTSEADADKNTVFLPDTFFSNAHYTPIQSGSTTSGIWEILLRMMTDRISISTGTLNSAVERARQDTTPFGNLQDGELPFLANSTGQFHLLPLNNNAPCSPLGSPPLFEHTVTLVRYFPSLQLNRQEIIQSSTVSFQQPFPSFEERATCTALSHRGSRHRP